jgi:hypothetical protein
LTVGADLVGGLGDEIPCSESFSQKKKKLICFFPSSVEYSKSIYLVMWNVVRVLEEVLQNACLSQRLKVPCFYLYCCDKGLYRVSLRRGRISLK